MRRAGLALTVVAAALAAAPAQAAAPRIEQMVVPRSGDPLVHTVRAAAQRTRVSGRRCAIPEATPLAALIESPVRGVRLRDFGSCSVRARDAGGIYVSAIGSDRARGQSGWVYKVGNRLATAGAADPTGPFGRGRLREGRRVTWFYCRLRGGSCQRTLVLTHAPPTADGDVVVRVRAYDDEGRGTPATGATVLVDGAPAGNTSEFGGFTANLTRGEHTLGARLGGRVPAFPVEVTVP